MADEPSLASHAASIIWEQKYVAKQAAFMDAQRKRRQAGIKTSSPEEQRARGRAKSNFTRYGERWSKERVVLALRAWHAEHGKWPNSALWEKAAEGRPSSDTVRRLFGKWPDALREAQR